MRPFNNHFGMVMQTIIAFMLSLLMSVFAVLLDGKIFGDPGIVLTWQGALKNWGFCFLLITVVSWIFPLSAWTASLCGKWNIPRDTIKYAIVENTIASLVFNLFATLCMSALNMFGNPELEGAAAAGAIPSVAFVWWHTVLRDIVIMFVFSWVVAWFVTRFALGIAQKSAKANIEQALAMRGGAPEDHKAHE